MSLGYFLVSWIWQFFPFAQTKLGGMVFQSKTQCSEMLYRFAPVRQKYSLQVSCFLLTVDSHDLSQNATQDLRVRR